MSLLLVQHGKSAPAEVDPARGLTQSGRDEVRRVAGLLGGGKVRVDYIYHSGKDRAKQTAEIFDAALKPSQGITVCAGIAPMDDVADFAAGLDLDCDQMFVGHLPFMDRLASHLLAGDQDRGVVTFCNGGVVCLRHESDRRVWTLAWTVVPDLIP